MASLLRSSLSIGLFVLGALVAGCTTSPPAVDEVVDPAMVPFGPGRRASISPSVRWGAMRSNTYLVYRMTEDGRGITTSFRGAAHEPSVPTVRRTELRDGWYHLIASVPHSEVQVDLAVWRLDEDGTLVDAHVRTKPFLTWRALGIQPGQVVSSVEWKPLVDGIPVGEWRR